MSETTLSDSAISLLVKHVSPNILDSVPKTHLPLNFPLVFPTPLHSLNFVTILHLTHSVFVQSAHTSYFAAFASDPLDTAILGIMGLFISSTTDWGPDNLLGTAALKTGIMTEEKTVEMFGLEVMRETQHETMRGIRVGQRWEEGVKLVAALSEMFKELGENTNGRCVGEDLREMTQRLRQGNTNEFARAFTEEVRSTALEQAYVAQMPHLLTSTAVLPPGPLRLLQDLAFRNAGAPAPDFGLPEPSELANVCPLPLPIPLLLYLGVIELSATSFRLSDLRKAVEALRGRDMDVFSDTPRLDTMSSTSQVVTVPQSVYDELEGRSMEACSEIRRVAHATLRGADADVWKMSFIARLCEVLAGRMKRLGLDFHISLQPEHHSSIAPKHHSPVVVMVLINDKKFACATCIKGHRVSGCTHTDRPLFEVKKKGRPATQCQYCREKRKGGMGTVHTRCACGEKPIPAFVSSGSETSQPVATRPDLSPSSTPGQSMLAESVETRKGVPGSTPTFPHGFKDVHDRAAADSVLAGSRGAEGFLDLLNPCTCKITGICSCCRPKREQNRHPSPSSSNHISGKRDPAGHAVTESLIEMFKSKATTSVTPPESSSSANSEPESSRANPAQLMIQRDPYLSPENMHHPAHTSPHVHKTKLYSPYNTNGHVTPKHGSRREIDLPLRSAGWASMSALPRPPPPKIRPLADMNTFLAAIFRDDGTIASEIPRSALGLPGIQTFDAIAEVGGVRIEPMEVDEDGTLTFPTSEDVVIAACTCGEGCTCPGCAIHGTPSRVGDIGHGHEGACSESCKSNFDCTDHLSVPSGITSIGHLLSLAAANVPPPARSRSNLELDAHDIRILPPAVHVNQDAARTSGLVHLRPLGCCNGRCQCKVGHPFLSSEQGIPVASSSGRSSPLASLGGTPPAPGIAPVLRRSSSTSRNHANLNGHSPALSRRATVNSASTSATQRFASTGKATNKALALHAAHHSHPRPILPKPSSHVLPAKSSVALVSPATINHPNGGGKIPLMGQNFTSSSQSSRAHSPASSSTGGLGEQHPELASSSQTAFAQQDWEYTPDLPRPIASNDPSDSADLHGAWSELASDADLLAYLDLFSSRDGAPSDAKPPLKPIDPNIEDQVLANGSFPYPQPADGLVGGPDQDFYDFLAQSMDNIDLPLSPDALAGPSNYEPPLLPSFPFPIEQPLPADSTETGSKSYEDYFKSDSMPSASGVSTNSSYQFGAEFSSTALSSDSRDDALLRLGVPTELYKSTRQQKAVREAASATSEGLQNPNLIDLSRPLQAGDVERILQALQQQQERQQTSTIEQPPSVSGEDDLCDDFLSEPTLSRVGNDNSWFSPNQLAAMADQEDLDLTQFHHSGDEVPATGLTQTQKDLIGGSVGGIAQVLVGQPFDIVKVRVQTAAPGTFASPLECARVLLKHEGPSGFYKGTLTPLLGIGELWASGAIAGVANTVIANPVEHIRIRLQTQPNNITPKLYDGPLDCAVKLYRAAGLGGVFKGQVSTMWRDGLGYGSYFLVYEWLVQRHLRMTGAKRDEISPLWAVTYGAAAGYGLWASIYPIDVIKSKLQTDSLDPTKREFSGMVDCARTVWRKQGWRGFAGGLGPTLIRSPFANGATFVAFEMAMRAMATG
ncbi:MAG: hypothetical protein TREMPRED_005358 [Tremellales sp. Tagirdzhanova-0007]|nr:MAG: hypothetical protein TREMPRED_005358 [Tremellales sp. Tagirdzhanova-0007]